MGGNITFGWGQGIRPLGGVHNGLTGGGRGSAVCNSPPVALLLFPPGWQGPMGGACAIITFSGPRSCAHTADLRRPACLMSHIRCQMTSICTPPVSPHYGPLAQFHSWNACPIGPPRWVDRSGHVLPCCPLPIQPSANFRMRKNQETLWKHCALLLGNSMSNY